MGIFSNIWEGIKSFGRKVVEKVKDFFGGLKSTASEDADSISKMDSYDADTATVKETEDYTAVLSNLSVSYKDQARDMEENITDEVNEHFDDIIDQMNCLGFNTDYIKEEKKKIRRRVKGSITSQLSERLSLTDSECMTIVKMAKGSRKKKRMEEFSFSVIDESIEILLKKLKKSCSIVEEKISETVHQKISEQEKEIISKTNEINDLINQYNEGNFDSEANSVSPNKNIFVCSCVIDLLNVGK